MSILNEFEIAVKETEIMEALAQCKRALSELAYHPAFEGNAPEFNEGGIGYEANQKARRVLEEYEWNY